jgi:hypothetical protein
VINVPASAFVKFKPRNLDRYPRLDTVLMVEQALYDNRSDRTSTEIWRALPKKVLWTTYTTILDYLEYSGKIHMEPDKTVTWLWNPELMERAKRQGVEAEFEQLKSGRFEDKLLKELAALAEKKEVTKEDVVKAVRKIGEKLYAEESNE